MSKIMVYTNPNELVIKLNTNNNYTEGTNKFTYTGKEPKEVSITPLTIGAADKTHRHELSELDGVAAYGHKHPKTDITDFPTSMNNENAIIIQLNGGVSEGSTKFTYDGSIQKTLSITAANIGAATASHVHADYIASIDSLGLNIGAVAQEASQNVQGLERAIQTQLTSINGSIQNLDTAKAAKKHYHDINDGTLSNVANKDHAHGSLIYNGDGAPVRTVTTTLNGFRPSSDVDVGVINLGTGENYWKQVYAKNGTINTSDRNLKKDIEDLDDRYYEFLFHLLPKRFKFRINDSDRFHIGFIAQDVEDLMIKYEIDSVEFGGLCIHKQVDEKGEVTNKTYFLRYEEFIALLVLGWQRSANKIQTLEDKVDKIISELGIE